MFRKITKHLFAIGFLVILLYILMYCSLVNRESQSLNSVNVNDFKETYRKIVVKMNTSAIITQDFEYTSNSTLKSKSIVSSSKKSRIHKGKISLTAPDRITTSDATLIPEQMACKIPVLDPFNEEYMVVVNTVNPEPTPPCETSPKFRTDYNSNLIRVEGNEKYFGQVKCCYFKFTRGADDMQISRHDKECIPITKIKTKIPSEYEFITVKCKVDDAERFENVGYFGFVHLKPEVEKRVATHEQNPDHLSIILLGLDSVSQMNYQRYMTKTRKYIRENLSGIEFQGRNKVHESTFANVGPMLTGWTNDELTQTVKCWPNPPQSYFDDCPFIWKEFEGKGYRSVYGEDSIHRSIYLDATLNGFGKPIADYDFRTLIRGMEIMDGHDGCFNYQSSPEVLIDSVAKAAVAFRDKPYFHFTWITSFTHESAQATKYVDEPVLKLLEMMNAQNLLNKTAFFLLSDHGMTFGDYVQKEQGMLESRMPMLNVILPEWFRKKYSKAFVNLRTNAKRLSTPFDLHEMLTDLMDPTKTILNSALELRETEYYSKNRGISLFLPIPLNRTCPDAGIDDHWCVCWDKSPVHNPEDNTDVITAVYFSLDIINSKLRPFDMCDLLEMDKILSARELHPVSSQFTRLTNKHRRRYEVVFRVKPSLGIFQSTVILQKYRSPKIGGPISRINAYKHQGDCIDTAVNGTLEVKSLCFCSKD